jgi:ketosteroid isomerase-like protein
MAQAMEAHDAVALGACFATDYRSEQPNHPARAFRGADNVAKHWAGIFADVPDFRAETISATINGDTAWSEFRWSGHKRNGAAFEVRGVMVLGMAEGKIAWGRLYIEPVEQGGEDFEASAKRATR